MLAIAGSIGIVPKPIALLGGQAAGWALATAVAAIGLKTRPGDIRHADPALVAVMIGQSLLQLGVVLGLIYLLFR